MEGDLTGRTVRSLAGHDSGRLYIVLRTDGAFVFLSDGRLKPREGPKKKKIRHVEVLPGTLTAFTPKSIEAASNDEIRLALKLLKNRLAITFQEE